jgi:hypothetical protein
MCVFVAFLFFAFDDAKVRVLCRGRITRFKAGMMNIKANPHQGRKGDIADRN